jgi:hypothetical protein
MAAELESLRAYHPLEFPHREWHPGPSDSDLEATGRAYFCVGKDLVTHITRAPDSGEVRIHCKGYATMVHGSLGWALLENE